MRLSRLSLSLCFFLSGAAGLIYQILWLRVLALTFGVTAYAISTVLAGFMAGLGLGSLLAGRLARRIRRPLRVYALIEAGIGLTGALTLFAFAGAQDLYRHLHPVLEHAPGLLAVGRFTLAFLILLVPTSLMGATLPVVLRSARIRGPGASGAGAPVSLLYAVNTAGAIAGCLTAAFVLVGTLGVRNSIFLAAGINLFVSLVALLTGDGPAPEEEETAPASSPGERAGSYPPAVRTAAFWVIGASGMLSLAYEVLWGRLLGMLFDGTIYPFAVMLATFLLGLATGSAAVRGVAWRGRASPAGASPPGIRIPVALAAVEAGIGAACVLSLLLLSRYGWNAAPVVGWIPFFDRLGGHGALAGTAAVCFLALFPATFLMGASFPLAVEIVTAGLPDLSRRVGAVYAVNVGGSIAGSLLAGFVLIPGLGIERSLRLLVVANALLGIAMLLATARGESLAGRAAAGAAGEAPAPLLGRYPSLFLSLGTLVLVLVMLGRLPPLYDTLFASRFPREQVIWRHEGVENTVTVAERVRGGESDAVLTWVLYLNGHHQANDSPAMVRYHRLIGHLPMLLHADPRRALVIGLGGGATAGAVARHPGAAVECVELSPGVVEAAGFFIDASDRVLHRPNVTLRVDDGRNHLLLTRRKYDVITADILMPHHAGAGNLYSLEYYRLCRNALAPGGLMCQWLSKASPAQYRLMLRTFLAAFPYVTLWDGGGLAIGSNQPIRISGAALARSLADPSRRAALEAVGLSRIRDVGRLYAGSREQALRFAGAGPLLTDDRPLMEYFRSTPGADEPGAGPKTQQQIDAAFPVSGRRLPLDP